MNEPPAKAWQPLTFGGVARYGHAWLGRLFFACLIVAVLTASVVVWTASRAWFPVIEDSIPHLPPTAEIRGGKLTAPAVTRLAENLFLSISVDPLGEGMPPSLADVQVVLAPTEIRFRSLFGMFPIPYRPEWTVILNRADWEPKWSAWRPAVIAYLFFGTIVSLLATWTALGIVYAIPVRLLALTLKRSVSLWGAWKLSVAALLPAAILLTAAIAIYGLGQIRIAELALAWGLHFAVGWIFVIGGTFKLHHVRTRTNPFGKNDPEPETEPEEPRERTQKNPFKSSRRKR